MYFFVFGCLEGCFNWSGWYFWKAKAAWVFFGDSLHEGFAPTGANSPFWPNPKRQELFHLPFLRHKITYLFWDIKISKPHFMQFLKMSERNYNLQSLLITLYICWGGELREMFGWEWDATTCCLEKTCPVHCQLFVLREHLLRKECLLSSIVQSLPTNMTACHDIHHHGLSGVPSHAVWARKFDCTDTFKNRVPSFEYHYYPGYWMTSRYFTGRHNKLAKLRRHASRVHFAKILFG